jgi:perosamine synthetase
MSELALFGGPKAIPQPLTPYRAIGPEEVDAARKVIESGVLSRYLGTWSADFYGGETVQEFEQAWARHFRVRHAVSVNSNTSGLVAAVGAIGVEPGDEVIVTPWTMSATATAILVWNAIPVFADIEDETFNLDPVSIERRITPLTRAIVVSDIFGHAADLEAIMALARRHGLKVIEDAAQAPGALYRGRYAGTVADIGVFSLNFHKHIHTGEGGVCVTDADALAERMQLIRNHAESVVGDKGTTDLSNMVGFNFRMTEVEAAIGIEQLKKLPALSAQRTGVGARLTRGLAGLRGLRTPVVKPECSHVYYVLPLLFDEARCDAPRARVVEALRAEGVPVSDRYVNVHLLPMYQRRTAYGTKGFPWSSDVYKGHVSYDKGICPVAEDLQDRRYLGVGMCKFAYPEREVDLVIHAFQKVWAHLGELRG